MRVVRTSEQPGHAGRWETIRYAIDNNARTIRLCLIMIVVISAPSLALTASGLLPHLLSRLQDKRPVRRWVMRHQAAVSGVSAGPHCAT